MKRIKSIYKSLFLLLLIVACTEDNRNLSYLDSIAIPSELGLAYNVTQDNTGLVTLTPTATSAEKFEVYFGDNTLEPEELTQGESTNHTYAEGTYDVRLIAFNIKGESAEITQQLVVSFMAPQNLEVTIENDPAISKQVNVTATAEYAAMYDFYTGESGSTDPISANIGDTVSHLYTNPGIYTIRVVAKGAAIETTEYTIDFEVTEILQPITAAPTPQSAEQDVISIYSDQYTGVPLSEVNPNWGQSTTLTEIQVDGDNIWVYNALNYTGIVTDYGNPTDLSSMESVHFDYWTSNATTLGLKLVNTSYADGDPLKEDIEEVGTVTQGEWVSVDIPLSDYTTDVSGITQLLFDTLGNTSDVFIDNLYFYRAPTTTSGVTPIDFEEDFELSSFDGGDISVVANPDTNGNSSSMVARMIKNAGQPWAGSKITIPEQFSFPNTTVTAKVWSPRTGLNLLMKFEDAVPWPNVTASAEITATTTVANAWEELTFDFSGIDTSIEFYNLVMIMDNGTQGDGTDNYTIYIDDISTTPSLDFEPNFELSSFDGGDISVVANPDTNGNSSSMVARMIKNAGQPWAGSKITVPEQFTFLSGTSVSVKVWSPRAGLNLLMKFEDAVPWPNVTASAEITTTTTVANAWEELTFDFSGIDTSIEFYNLVMIMDNGTQGDGTDNYTIYIDDISQF